MVHTVGLSVARMYAVIWMPLHLLTERARLVLQRRSSGPDMRCRGVKSAKSRLGASLAAGLAFLDARGVVALRDAAAPGGAEFRRSWNASACAVCGSSSSSGGDGADLAIVVAAAAVFILGVGGAVVAGLAVRRRRRSTYDDPEELAKVIPS